MEAEIGDLLTIAQWDALRALRSPGLVSAGPTQAMLRGLGDLDLIAFVEGRPILTPLGRKVMLRGSARLWDVAA
jgi:hypothetical protein